jgi:small subunit ribosomal protein S17e
MAKQLVMSMGRIRTTYIKRMTKKILERFPDKFGKDFNKNKETLKEYTETPSKQLRNKVAGSITKTIKSQKD